MGIAIVIGALAVGGFNLWAGCQMVFGRVASSQLRIAYVAVLFVTAVVAARTTFWYEYFPDENTRICGWPVPVVIFQRVGAEAPWLDYVGPTTLLGYPMNLAIFMFVPSALFVYWSHREKLLSARADTESIALADGGNG